MACRARTCGGIAAHAAHADDRDRAAAARSQFAVGAAGLAGWFIRLGVTDTLLAVAIAHLIYTLPYVVVALAGAFSLELLEVARPPPPSLPVRCSA